ncbi:ComF family protein [Blastococcus sp. TML/M2B]|uniref:ComF family protein n=1 Tax=unclassified Blastococcus TaxID=2619396 RepID=UPI0019096ED7|nr:MULTISPECIES: ComF family protein [unclassified Blastococcus]MBN1093789.1 ComF family protein [Blastococcus sp. TML/M2B]MBN1096088.1 ComF family protein [Blastococcus sp. TML/C7B]
MGGSAWSALADLVLPRTCAGCGLPGAALCPGCGALLARPHLATPRRFPEGFPPTVAAGAYAGPVRPAVLAFKERGRAELARPLGTALALAVAAVVSALPGPPGEVLLVPVPSSSAALRSRGRDHVRELTGRAVRELRAAGLPAAQRRLLHRRGRVRDSAGLSAAQRRANLAGTFVLAPGAAAGTGPLVLVDDVVTSGATLTEAGAVLAGLAGPGALPVLAAVVAATPRERPRGTRGRLSGPGPRD